MGDDVAGLTRRVLLDRGGMGAALVVAAPFLRVPVAWAARGTADAALGTVVIAVPATPSSLNTDLGGGNQEFMAQHSIYDSLTTFPFRPPRNGVSAWNISSLDNVRPQLAEDFSQSKDGKQTTFKLRRGVMSEAGNELTTADIAFFFQELVAKSKSLRALVANLGNFDASKDVTIRDKYTFSIKHRTPSPLFLAGLTLGLGGIPDSTLLKTHVTTSDPTGAQFLATKGAGFGPFAVDSLVQGQQAVFSARNDYWGAKPRVDRIIMQAVPQSSNRLALLGRGVHIATALSPLQLKKAKRTANFAGNLQLYVTFQTKGPPFNNRDVRRAFQYATDYDAILNAVFRGTARRLYGALPSTYPDDIGKQYSKYEFDPAMARKLLKKAGYSRLNVEMAYDSSAPQTAETALQLQAAWRKSGINVDLIPLTSVQWGTQFIGGTYKHLIMFENQANVPDMGYVSALLYAKGAVANGGHYNNVKVNQLTSRANSSASIAERRAIAIQLQRILIDDPPCLWIAQPGIHYGLAAPVSSVGWETDNGIVFDKIA